MSRGNRRPSELCRPCISGIVPGRPLTFDPNCSRCREKLAAGLRTGLDPLPVTLSLRGRARMQPIAFASSVDRQKAYSRARVASGAALQPARGAL